MSNELLKGKAYNLAVIWCIFKFYMDIKLLTTNPFDSTIANKIISGAILTKRICQEFNPCNFT
jgi:hypothetical protein